MTKTETKANAPETWTITIEDGREITLSKPNRKQLGQAMGLMMPMGGGAPDVIGAGEWILNTCYVSGDRSILTDDEALIPAAMKALEMVKVKEATLKKN